MFGLLSKNKEGIFNVGLLEMAIALYPIIAGYGYGSFKLAFGFLLIIDVCLIGRMRQSNVSFRQLYQYLVFVVLHNTVWLFLLQSVPNYFVNSCIADVIYLVSIVLIVPHLDFVKLKNSIYIVAVVCIVGMIYHVLMIQTGHSIQPIKLPFMPEMGSQSRLYAYLDRPTSFFWEPQSYASFMLVPLFFLLRERQMLFAFLVAASMLVSTSTTGILMAMFMLAFFLLTQKQKIWYRVLGVAAIIGLVYFFLYSSFTSSGLEKLENTNLEENNRTINGLLIAQDMNFFDLIFGVPFANLQDAYEAGYITRNIIVMADGIVFVSAFWVCLCCQGVIGLFFFMNVYWGIFKQNKAVSPYLICIIISLFSNPDILGASYVFQLMIMYVFISYNQKHDEQLEYSNSYEN